MCVHLHSENSEPTMLFSQTMPDEHPPTPPPCRWPDLITLPTLAKFQLVWRRLCHVVLFPFSYLVEHTLTVVCVLPKYQPGRKREPYSNILWPSTCPLYFRLYLYRFVDRLELHHANVAPRRSSSFPLVTRCYRHAGRRLSSLYTPSPCFSSFDAACV